MIKGKKEEDSLDYKVNVFSLKYKEHNIEGELFIPSKYKSGVIVHHGAFVEHHSLHRYAVALAEAGYLVCTYDARGHGRSNREFSPDDMVEDAVYMVDYLTKNYRLKSMGILGQSLGGLIAAVVTARSPKIRSCALISPAIRPMSDFIGSSMELVDRAMEYLKGLVRDKRIKKEWIALPRRIFQFTTEGGLTGIVRNLWELRKGDSDMNIIDLYDAMKNGPDAMECASKINVPCYIFHGSSDKLVPMKSVERFYEALASRDKQLFVYKGGHEIYQKNFRPISGRIIELFARSL